jgi:hypothetical protein
MLTEVRLSVPKIWWHILYVRKPRRAKRSTGPTSVRGVSFLYPSFQDRKEWADVASQESSNFAFGSTATENEFRFVLGIEVEIKTEWKEINKKRV